MVTDILQPTHLLFILVVALLVLGPKRLPEVARTLGNGLRDFRSAISGEQDDERPGRPGHYALPEDDSRDAAASTGQAAPAALAEAPEVPQPAVPAEVPQPAVPAEASQPAVPAVAPQPAAPAEVRQYPAPANHPAPADHPADLATPPTQEQPASEHSAAPAHDPSGTTPA